MKRLIGILTLSMTLASPAVAQLDEPQALLRKIAGLGLVEQVLSDNPFLQGWRDAVLRDGLLYYDLSGQPALYEVGVEVHGERAGRIKLAANPLYATTVLSVESTPRSMPLFDAAWTALALVSAWHGDAQLVAALPLAYDGLKTGVAVVYVDPQTDLWGLEVVDLTSLESVPLEQLNSLVTSVPPEQVAERSASFFAEIDYALMMDELVAVEGLQLANVFVEPFDPHAWTVLEQVPGHLVTNEPHITVDLTRCKLYIQETGDWCARAVHQMFNHYYQGSAVHSQTHIDALLNNHGWPNNWKAAMSWYFDAYTLLSDSGFNYVGPWMKAQDVWPALTAEINWDRPFGLYTSNGSVAHITFDVGYQVKTKPAPSKPGGESREYWLHVYDPLGGVQSIQAWKDDLGTAPHLIAGYFHARP